MTVSNKTKVLVAYFSHSGNTEKIAWQIQKLSGGDIFEIQSAVAYPQSYDRVLAVARQEKQSGTTPELKKRVANMEQYEVVFIGYPNWWNTYPAAVQTFFNEHDFNGKTIVPFCTHGGGGMGQSIAHINGQLPAANILNGFAISGYAVDENNGELKKWFTQLKK